VTSGRLKNIIYTATFAAIICVTTLTVKVPAAGGYYHIGDAFIYLSGVCLPLPCAPIAGALGSSLSDLLSGYAIYAIPTFVIKAIIALFFTNKKIKILCVNNFIAIIIAAFITVGGYYLAEAVILNSFAGALATIYGNTGQAVASAVLFIAISAAFDSMRVREKIFK